MSDEKKIGVDSSNTKRVYVPKEDVDKKKADGVIVLIKKSSAVVNVNGTNVRVSLNKLPKGLAAGDKVKV